MSYAPDPAGDFASDPHRRVMAAVPTPDTERTLEERIAGDEHLHVSPEEVEEILKDLEADGHITQTDEGWRHTEDGHALLTGPPKEARDE